MVKNKPCPVYETTVRVVFKDEEAKNTLSVDFRNHVVVGNSVILITLYFPQPEEFKEFAGYNAEETVAKWKSYDANLEET